MARSVQRDAERVTAAEVTLMANELENSLGGIYSILTQEFQLKYLKKDAHAIRSGKAPKLPKRLVNLRSLLVFKGLVVVMIVISFEFIGTVSQALGPDIMRQYMNVMKPCGCKLYWYRYCKLS